MGPADICCHNPLFREKVREKKKKKKEGKYLD
jgi:stalled ribosome alternative rescue factor ArfA